MLAGRRAQGQSGLEALESRCLLSGEPWGVFAQMIGFDRVAQDYPQLTGQGMTIAVIDSGIDYNHPAFGGFGPGHKIIGGWDFVDNDSNPYMSDNNVHATGVVGVLAPDPYVYKGYLNEGYASGANIIVLRQDSSYRVKLAMQWVLDHRQEYNIVAVNVTDFYQAGFNASLYRTEAKALKDAGVFITSPCGNEGSAVPVTSSSAAGDPSIFGSAPVDRYGALPTWAQRDSNTDVLAPGVRVTLPWYDVKTSQEIITDYGAGSSWSAPHITATAVLIKQINPSFTPDQIMGIIRDTGTTSTDAVTGLTFTRLNMYAAVQLAYNLTNGTAVSTPFNGKAASVPGIIDLENYDEGGEGVGYHDLTLANQSMQYRANGVDIEKTSDIGGGYNLGYAQAGEWLNYTVNVAAAGTYRIDMRVANPAAGATFHIEVDGTNVSGTLGVPNTAGWQRWTTVSARRVTFSAGTHTMRLVFDTTATNGFVGNLNWMQVVAATPAAQTAYAVSSVNATSIALEAENFDRGGEGVAYHDWSAGNASGQYRTSESVDIERCAEGGYDVSWTLPGEWLEYTMNVGASGAYNLDLRAAYNGALANGGTVHFEVDGVDVTGPMTIAKTGAWQTWQTSTKKVNLPAGQHVLRLAFDKDGAGTVSGYLANINWVKLTRTGTTQPVLPTPWTWGNVGAVGPLGGATGESSAFTVCASGTDVWDYKDSFGYVYQSWTGDGTLIARVDSMDNTSGWAKAGLMFRENLSTSSRNVYMAVSATNGTAFQYRATAGGGTTGVAGPLPAVSAPCWLKLVRKGSIFSGYQSVDGTTWTLVATQTISLSSTLYVGLAVTACNNAVLNAAGFSNVSIR